MLIARVRIGEDGVHRCPAPCVSAQARNDMIDRADSGSLQVVGLAFLPPSLSRRRRDNRLRRPSAAHAASRASNPSNNEGQTAIASVSLCCCEPVHSHRQGMGAQVPDSIPPDLAASTVSASCGCPQLCRLVAPPRERISVSRPTVVDAKSPCRHQQRLMNLGLPSAPSPKRRAPAHVTPHCSCPSMIGRRASGEVLQGPRISA